MIISLKQKREDFLLILSYVFPVWFVVSVYTSAGPYTRWTLPIVPFLLIFAAFTIDKIVKLKLFSKKNLQLVLVCTLTVFTVYLPGKNIMALIKDHRKPWNFEALRTWISENVVQGNTLAVHGTADYYLPKDKEFNLIKTEGRKTYFDLQTL